MSPVMVFHLLARALVLSRTDLQTGQYTGQLRLLRAMLVKLPVPRFDYPGGAAAREQARIAAHRANRAGAGLGSGLERENGADRAGPGSAPDKN